MGDGGLVTGGSQGIGRVIAQRARHRRAGPHPLDAAGS